MTEERNQGRAAADEEEEMDAVPEVRNEEETLEAPNFTSNTPQRQHDQKVLLDPELGHDDSYPLGRNEDVERLMAEDNAARVMDEMREATEDVEVLEDFAERQEMPTDEQNLFRQLREHHAETPQLSAGDLDARWDQSGVGDDLPSAEPTPDQDIVDEIGGALGVTYDDDEELDFAEKVHRRDVDRYELDLDSVEDNLDEQGLDEEDLEAEENDPDLDDSSWAEDGEEDGDEPFELTTSETRPE
jgi:hypothetical protein